MIIDQFATVHYSVYETQGDSTGYAFRPESAESWFTEDERRQALSLTSLLKRTVSSIYTEPTIEYQSMVSTRTIFGVRIFVFCWLDYYGVRPSPKFLILRIKHTKASHIIGLCMRILEAPNDWLKLIIPSPFSIYEFNNKTEFELKDRLSLLEAIMTSHHVIVPAVTHSRIEELIPRVIGMPPHFLLDWVLIGHNLKEWPKKQGTCLVIDGPQTGKGVLSLNDHEDGPIVEIGQQLRDSSNAFSQERILRLCWMLYRGRDSRNAALHEIKAGVDIELWNNIRRITKFLPLSWIKFKNKNIIS